MTNKSNSCICSVCSRREKAEDFRPKPRPRRPTATLENAVARSYKPPIRIVAGIPKSGYPHLPTYSGEIDYSPIDTEPADLGPDRPRDDPAPTRLGLRIADPVFGRNPLKSGRWRCRKKRRRKVEGPHRANCRRNLEIRISRRIATAGRLEVAPFARGLPLGLRPRLARV